MVTGIFATLFTAEELNVEWSVIDCQHIMTTLLISQEAVADPLGLPPLIGTPLPDFPQQWQWLFLYRVLYQPQVRQSGMGRDSIHPVLGEGFLYLDSRGIFFLFL